MITVYALRNAINNEIYIGITNNITRRLKEHNSGKNRYTKAFAPWDVFYTEECVDYSAARFREKSLKTITGRRYLREVLQKMAI
jgi:predicted GIY-YIG superfamily endonuclease